MIRYLLIFSLVSFFSFNAVAEDVANVSALSQENEGVYNDVPLSDEEIDISFIDDMEDIPVTQSTVHTSSPSTSLSKNGMNISPVNQKISQPVAVNGVKSVALPTAKIDKDQSLTDIFDEKAGEGKKNVKEGETWLDRLRSSAEEDLKGGKEPKSKDTKIIEPTSTKDGNLGLNTLVENTKNIGGRRSNAAVFDVSGAMLRMNPKQIDDILTRKGYKKTNEKYEIPNFIKWRKEDECRAAGVIGYERLANCVVQSAKAENYQYAEVVSYAKYDTQESITINFTSNFTSNKAFKIVYNSMSSNITGNSQKAVYLRNIKIYDFWKRINQKYGAPDNKEDVMWGLGGNKPYMQAKTGKLLLEDPMLRELDYTRMSREDQKFINTGVYNF